MYKIAVEDDAYDVIHISLHPNEVTGSPTNNYQIAMRRRKPTYYSLPDSEMSITASKLRRADRGTQLEVMRAWFYANYENPVENTPYESAEGGYIYIWGGPYDPKEELDAQFSGLIPSDVIAELAKDLSDISYQWTGHSEHDEYLFESIAQTTKHHDSFNEAISNVEHLLTIDISAPEKQHLLRLLYVNVVTTVETYLSDIFISTVGNDDTLLRRFVETNPEFMAEKISLSNVFKAAEEMEKKARTYLMDVVWHHLARVKPMFKDTMDIDFPDDMKALFKAVYIRHDLVHRNGKTKEGGEHIISVESVKNLVEVSRSFVAHIDKQWAEQA